MKSQKGGQISRKRGQKGGLGGEVQKGGHGRAPSQKEDSGNCIGFSGSWNYSDLFWFIIIYSYTGLSLSSM